MPTSTPARPEPLITVECRFNRMSWARLDFADLRTEPGRHQLGTDATASLLRAAAGSLLGNAYVRTYPDQMVPHTQTTTALPPTSSTATTTTWTLPGDITLTYRVPFEVTLTVEHDQTLSPEEATLVARALLGAAREVQHAHIRATHVIHAERAGLTPIDAVRAWLTHTKATCRLSDDQNDLAKRLLYVLSEEEKADRGRARAATLDVAHPELPNSVADLSLLAPETLTHLDAAKAIDALADRYGIPISRWTAKTGFITDEIGQLNESEWLRLAQTEEFQDFSNVFAEVQANGREGINVQIALQQAGLVCRNCGDKLTGALVSTLGHCDECRPETLGDVLALGCPDNSGRDLHRQHRATAAGTCLNCGIPLTEQAQHELAAAGNPGARPAS